MATSTSNLGLTLPSVNDAADIAVLNSNFQKIDGKIPAAGAAPSGYGLGERESKLIAQSDDLDNYTLNGWYQWANAPTHSPIGNYGRMFVSSGVPGSVTQFITSQYAGDKKGVWLMRTRTADTIGWGEWEWVNPPMIPGVEYRTTERWNGKPVYTKAVNCGAMGQNTVDDVYHDAVNIAVVWVSGGYWFDGSTRLSIPYIGGSNDNQIFVSAYGSAIHRVHKGSVYNILDMTVMIKYTKGTD